MRSSNRGVWCKSTAFRSLQTAISARSSKRTGGPIPRVAPDQCRVPERYRTRAPFRTPERETARAVPLAGCEPVEETGQGFDPFRPCGVVQPTRLFLKQEIAGPRACGAARDATFRRVVRGEQQTHLTQTRAVPRLRDASPLSPTSFTESKPQQTGTRLLIRFGEGATPSGSTQPNGEWKMEKAER